MTSHVQSNRNNVERASSSSCDNVSNNNNNGPHLDIALWLKTLELTQYRSLFESSFNGVEDLLDLSGRQILDLGVKNGAHRTRLVASLAILKEKYQNSISLASSVKSSIASDINRMGVETDESGYLTKSLDDRKNSNSGTLEFKKKSSKNSLDNGTIGSKLSSSEELCDQFWYHGSVGRSKAEGMVLYSGQFLIRDCVSKPGDYVLTCNWDGRPVHFMINRVVVNRKAIYERVVYQFEDEQYSSVPALIKSYVSERKPVTRDSMCIISEPVNRSKPLDETIEPNGNRDDDCPAYMKYKATNNNLRQRFDDVNASNDKLDNSVGQIPSTSASIMTRPLPPVPLSQNVLKHEAQCRLNVKWNSESALVQAAATPVNGSSKIQAFGSVHSLANASVTTPRRIVNIEFENVPLPPKPTRAPSLKSGKRPAVVIRNKEGLFKEIRENDADDEYHEYCDIDYDDVPSRSVDRPDSGFHSKSPETTNVIFRDSLSMLSPPPLPPRTPGGTNDRDSACVPDMGFYDRPNPLCQPKNSCPVVLQLPSRICLSSFHCDILPSDVKPLDVRVWPEIRDAFLGVGSHRLAAAITKEDVEFLQINGDGEQCSKIGCGVKSGLLHILLPFGDQLRADILERTTCWKYFVITTLLKAKDLNERTEILAKWIDTARQLKDLYKNFYAFSNIMAALSSNHAISLRNCWRKLRTEYTELAVTFETRLRASWQQLQKCDDDMNSLNEICIPDVDPLARLFSAKMSESTWLYEWEDFDSSLGIDFLWSRLETYRRWFVDVDGLCKRLNKIIDSEMDTTGVSTIFFRSEFHMKFLWGAKGAFVDSIERYDKFEQLLTLLVEKCRLEPSN